MYCAAEGARRGTPTWTKRSKVASECFSLNVRSPPFVTVARRREGFTLTFHVRPRLSYAAPGPNDRFRERAASVSLAAGFVIYQRISRSPAVVSAVRACRILSDSGFPSWGFCDSLIWPDIGGWNGQGTSYGTSQPGHRLCRGGARAQRGRTAFSGIAALCERHGHSETRERWPAPEGSG